MAWLPAWRAGPSPDAPVWVCRKLVSSAPEIEACGATIRRIGYLPAGQCHSRNMVRREGGGSSGPHLARPAAQGNATLSPGCRHQGCRPRWRCTKRPCHPGVSGKPPDTHRVWSCAPPRVTVGLQRILPRRLDGSVSLVGHSSQSFVRPVGEDLFLGGLHPVFNQIASRRSGRECGACGDCYTRCHAKRMSVLVHDRPSARSANRDSVAPAVVP